MKNSIKLLLTGVVSALCAGILRAQDSWQSQLLKVAGDGALTYEEFYKLKYCSTVVYMVPRA